MKHYRTLHSAPAGRVVDTIILDCPDPLTACITAAQWALSGANDILPGELSLMSLRVISEREAFSPLLDERDAAPRVDPRAASFDERSV